MKYWVYVHTFPNKKYYVGLSTMENINQRWRNGLGYYPQKLIYRAILKYGWKNIKHTVYQCDTEKEMKYLEKYLIAYYQSNNPKYGYNITDGGEGTNGLVRENRKAIDQYDKFGNFIKTWDSTYSVEKALNYKNSAISACARKKCPTAYGFYWCYTGEKPNFKTYGTQRKVYQYDLEGNFIAEYKNATEAGRCLGKFNGNIINCCNGRLKSAYNFIWRYENNNLS